MKKNLNRLPIILVLLLFVGVGIILLQRSHAATPSAALEPEAGSVTGSAVSVTDSTASGGEAIKFTTASTPPPTTG